MSEAIPDEKHEDSPNFEDENDEFQPDIKSSKDMEIPEGDASFNIDTTQGGEPNLRDPRNIGNAQKGKPSSPWAHSMWV